MFSFNVNLVYFGVKFFYIVISKIQLDRMTSYQISHLMKNFGLKGVVF